MYTQLKANGTGGFANYNYDIFYRSSSEYDSYSEGAWYQGFRSGYQGTNGRDNTIIRVRPVRAF